MEDLNQIMWSALGLTIAILFIQNILGFTGSTINIIKPQEKELASCQAQLEKQTPVCAPVKIERGFGDYTFWVFGLIFWIAGALFLVFGDRANDKRKKELDEREKLLNELEQTGKRK